MEIAVITGPKTTPSLQRYAYDACPRVGQNNFTPALSTGGVQVDIAGKNYTFKWKTPPITITNGLITRIIPIYHDGKIAVKSTAILPQQGNLIESTGTSGETKRRVNVFQGHPKIPTELFPYSIFSPQ
ncbi:MAG: hypothetical protein ACD_50C00145G0001 [uncultured bacterium]|nr:MAG: hypothetical protein ACD_50C00145G0001 [uncultured bacterium]